MFSTLKRSLLHLACAVAVTAILVGCASVFTYQILWFNGHTPSIYEINLCMAFMAWCTCVAALAVIAHTLRALGNIETQPFDASMRRSLKYRFERVTPHLVFGFVTAVVLMLTAWCVELASRFIMFDGLAKTITAHAVDTILFAGLAALLWQFMRATYENVRT